LVGHTFRDPSWTVFQMGRRLSEVGDALSVYLGTVALVEYTQNVGRVIRRKNIGKISRAASRSSTADTRDNQPPPCAARPSLATLK